MYSKEDNLLMIHIPKTGGQTILKSFLTKYGYGTFENDDLNQFLGGRQKIGEYEWIVAHLTYKQYRQLGIFTKEQLDELTKFTIVRNPYYRFVSFLYMIQKKGGRFANYTLQQHMSKVGDWLKSEKTGIQPHKGYVMSKPQYLFLEGCNDVKIFKQENYSEVEEFLKQYGIEKIKKSNVTPEHMLEKREQDIATCKDFVNKHFEKDFEMFGYEMR